MKETVYGNIEREIEYIYTNESVFPVGLYVTVYRCNALGERFLLDQKKFSLKEEK